MTLMPLQLNAEALHVSDVYDASLSQYYYCYLYLARYVDPYESRSLYNPHSYSVWLGFHAVQRRRKKEGEHSTLSHCSPSTSP